MENFSTSMKMAIKFLLKSITLNVASAVKTAVSIAPMGMTKQKTIRREKEQMRLLVSIEDNLWRKKIYKIWKILEVLEDLGNSLESRTKVNSRL